MSIRGSSVSIVTGLRAGRPGLDSRQEQGFSLLAGAHPAFYPLDIGGKATGE
jgi:hypothetical protein